MQLFEEKSNNSKNFMFTKNLSVEQGQPGTNTEMTKVKRRSFALEEKRKDT